MGSNGTGLGSLVLYVTLQDPLSSRKCTVPIEALLSLVAAVAPTITAPPADVTNTGILARVDLLSKAVGRNLPVLEHSALFPAGDAACCDADVEDMNPRFALPAAVAYADGGRAHSPGPAEALKRLLWLMLCLLYSSALWGLTLVLLLFSAVVTLHRK